MRLSHGTQLVLKALQSWEIACGTNTSEYLFPCTFCNKALFGGNSRLVISRRSWYISHIEQVD